MVINLNYMAIFQKLFDLVYMDYEGQRTSEWLYQRIVLVFAVVGFVVGYYFQMFSYTVGSLGLGSVVATLVCGLPWPCYRKHPLKWQPVSDSAAADTVPATTSSHGEGKKRKNK
ncbi:signal peptidase complex subunit 1-like [Paramacrobiotus metropolitanus]|uniref:signal peptidase complex subunit 1-like n=1 Tax=Paramacrobiotus metropolitanus TaxID=2943436 RepID=UPI0024462AA9|nr:signal peptidase complex subunit 1-like [Paramacrobiotus metropolitanus]